MSRMNFFQIIAVFPMVLMLCACSTNNEYAGVIEKKMEMVRYEEREPITTLALVQKPKLDDGAVKNDDDDVAPQDVETAAGEESDAPISSHFN